MRRELGLQPGDDVDVVLEDGAARIVPLPAGTSRGLRLVERLRGAGDVDLGMSTDELMALLRGDD